MIEKDKVIDRLSAELNDIKMHVRKQETLNYENKLKEANRISVDKSIIGYDTNEAIMKCTRDLARSRSPFNDNTISETIMYGGASVLDSMIASFPVEKNSVTVSQEIDSRPKESISPQIRYTSRNIQNKTESNLKSFKISEEMSDSSQSIHQTSENFNKFRIDNFTKRLSDYDKDKYQNKTERMEYLNENISSTSNLFLPQQYSNLEKNKSTTMLANNFSNLSTFNNDSNHIKQRINTDKNFNTYFDNSVSNYSKLMEENIANINTYYENDNMKNNKIRTNIPYQDTFDNCGANFNQPLASARYQHLNTINDSCSSDQNKDVAATHRIRHLRNISHASFPSDESEECKNPNSKTNIKHSQSVLQFKDRFKVDKKRLLRVEIDPYDNTDIDTINKYQDAIMVRMPITVKDKGKENDKRALNNMKAIPLNAVSKQKRPNQQSITPRETHKQSNGFGYICNQKQKNLNKAHQDQRECISRNNKRRTHSSQFIPRPGETRESYDNSSPCHISMFDYEYIKSNESNSGIKIDPLRVKQTPKNSQNFYNKESQRQKEKYYSKNSKNTNKHKAHEYNAYSEKQSQKSNGDVYAAKYSYKSYIDTSINSKQNQSIPDRDYSPSIKTYELCNADDDY